MNKLNQEQYQRLTKYKVHLRRGIGDYVYGLYQNDFDELLAIYKELGGNERIKYSCSTCQLRLTKTLGKLYFKFEAEMNRDKIEKLSDEVVEAVLEEKLPDEEEEPKKKRTRKPKTTKKEVQ